MKMELNIKINLDNSSFENGNELNKCLNQVISYFQKNVDGECKIFDSNGNKVGQAIIIE